MATKKKTKSAKFPIFGNRNTDFFISVLISIVFILVVLTYNAFFFINPMNALTPWLAGEQVLSMIGWISFILVVPVIKFLGARTPSLRRIGLVSWLVWPAALILIHLSLWVTAGNPFLGYLVTYPIFFFTDVIAPLIYFLMWRNQKSV